MSGDPLHFALGLHLHQPVGNFDHVFEEHVRDAYHPFLRRAADHGLLPIALHVSGPLLEWLEAHDTTYLDLIGRLTADGHLELLLGGFYEPILAALPRADRVEQIAWMRDALRRRFGVDAIGLWLTERVWEPDLPVDLAEAGVRYVLVDDRHFLVSGYERHQLHAPWWTESDGRRVAVFPIDERLRYLVPFQPPEDTAAYLRQLRAAGHQLAVLADDGEKFGGWPGTKDWVYTRGWLDRFAETMSGLVDAGEVRLTTFAWVLDHVPSAGLCYLPTASYREMETWALPARAAVRLAALERTLGKERLAGPDGGLVRGAHWRNFLAKYPESNRMHKKMCALSALCRARGDPPEARRAVARSQCNDAYWHGVFGGLYLPHLRAAVWRNLILAERELRAGEPLDHEIVDLDADGHEEVWIHSAAFSALVSPARGGAVEEYSLFDQLANLADVLTRRREAYHERPTADGDPPPAGTGDGMPSIHELEHAAALAEPPPVDDEPRTLFVDRVLPAELRAEDYAQGTFQPVASWARAPLAPHVRTDADAIELVLRPAAGTPPGLIEKRLRFERAGRLSVRYRWDPAAFAVGAWFAPELSVTGELHLVCDPPADVWTFPVTTVAQSERGFDRTVQGTSYTPRWPVSAGEAHVALGPPEG